MIRTRIRPLIFFLIWLAVFALALAGDRYVAQWVSHANLYDKHDRAIWLIKWGGTYWLSLVVAALLLLLHRRSRAVALALLLSGPLVGISYTLVKWGVGRRRPVIAIAPFELHPFAHGLVGLLNAERGLSFPSGHAAMAFATATCLAAALPRWGTLFFIGAAMVAAERVLENAHYLSDVVAGAGIGIGCGMLAMSLCRRWLNTPTLPSPGIPGEEIDNRPISSE